MLYTDILTRTMRYCKLFFFHNFAIELRPLIDSKICCLLHNLKMNGQNLIKFCIHIIIKRIANLQQSYDFIDGRTGPTLDCGVSCP